MSEFDKAFKKYKYKLEATLRREFLMDVIDVDVAIGFAMDEVVSRIRGHVWGESESVQKVSITYPADWKQAVKERFFPAWALKRWPVRNKIITMDVKCFYPNFRPKLDGEEHRLVIFKKETEREDA